MVNTVCAALYYRVNMSAVLPPVSFLGFRMVGVWSPVSFPHALARCMGSCLVLGVSCLVSGVSCRMSCVSYLVGRVSHFVVSRVWCLVSRVSCVVTPISCVVCDVSYLVVDDTRHETQDTRHELQDTRDDTRYETTLHLVSRRLPAVAALLLEPPRTLKPGKS